MASEKVARITSQLGIVPGLYLVVHKNRWPNLLSNNSVLIVPTTCSRTLKSSSAVASDSVDAAYEAVASGVSLISVVMNPVFRVDVSVETGSSSQWIGCNSRYLE